MSNLDQWLKDNKLTSYATQFKQEIDGLEDLSTETLENDDAIREFIKNDIGETKTIKAKKIFNAIKKLQEANDSKLDIQKYGFNFMDIISVEQEKQIVVISDKYKNKLSITEKQYYDINVTDAMNKLATCGSLIQLAYASSNGFKCQSFVVKLLSKYHTLVKESYIASSQFVASSMSSLQFHKIAIQIINKKPDKAISFISKCSELAGKMALVADNLSVKAGELANIAENALEQAVTDKTITDEEREKVKTKIAKAKAQEAQLVKMTKSLAQQHQQIKQEEAKAIAEAKKERDRQFTLSIINATVGAVANVAGAYMGAKGGNNNNNNNNNNNGNNDNNNNDDDEKKEDIKGKSADDRAWLLTQKKYEIQDKLIEQNAELEKTLSELSSCGDKKNQLQRALKSIELTIKTLGKIKVIFENTKVFWQGVQKNCDRLKQIGGNINEFVEDPDLFKQQIKDSVINSALNWFVLCKVNYFAKRAISQVNKGMDEIMNDLPDENEALQLVSILANDLKQQLKDETDKIKEIKAIEQSKNSQSKK